MATNNMINTPTLTFGGPFTMSGAFPFTGTLTATTTVTFPTSGTLATTTQIPSLPLSGANGGTGVANTGSTITIGGNVAFSGAHTFTGTLSGDTAVTFPTSGTLATTSQLPTLPLSLSNGGTNASLAASNGGIFYSTASAGAILSGTATANQVLLSGASTTPAWSTATYPASTTVSQILYSSSANIVAGLATANNAILVTSATGVPSLTAGGQIPGTQTNSNANSRNFGEYITSNIPAASAVSLTTATPKDITSISLTSGDWNIYGNVYFIIGGIATSVLCWTSSISATQPDTSLITGTTGITLGTAYGTTTPFLRASLSGTTTIYLSAIAVFSTSTVTACGSIFARRAR